MVAAQLSDTAGDGRIVEVLDDADAVSERAADWLAGCAAQTTGRFALALSGGSTPRHLYELLARPPHRDRVPWDRAHLFWGDERFVPHDHPDSNYRMVREALLDRVPIPAANVHPIPTEGAPEDAARAYEGALKSFYGMSDLDPARPLFDVVLLGIGQDGHTASLFPGSPALDERSAWVMAVSSPRREARITLTYPALASSRTIAFLVAGEDKRAIAARVRSGEIGLPAARIRTQGQLRWFMDRAAAGDEGPDR
jgi:6-phosphogluconolactonase